MTLSNHLLKKEIAKILLVDDIPANLVTLEAILEGNDREVYMACSADEALGLVMRHDFTLIMLDVQMPEINGFELAKMLKNNRRTGIIPIIFVTAHRFDADDVLQGYTEGAVDYLFKPLSPQITRAKVNAFIDMEYHRKQTERINLELDGKNKELERTNIALEELSYIIAHDLKEPLRTISGIMNVVLKKNQTLLDEKSLEYLNICINSASKLDHLIQDLLKYAKLGYSNIEKMTIDLNELINNTKNALLKRIEERNVLINIKGELPEVIANEAQMGQLFQNLIDNAIKYQKVENQPIINIWANEKKSFWEIHIQDNGIGMDPNFAKKAFGVFERRHDSNEFQGTGVGLATCKKIVENNDGEIHIQSEEGKGTTFIFTIPKLPLSAIKNNAEIVNQN